MKKITAPHLLVDVFAGPGGLGEGFLSYARQSDQRAFRGALSIEKDESAHRTLTLRHFLHAFPHGALPDDYYTFLKGGLTLEDLYANHPDEHRHAVHTARQVTLGPDSRSAVKSLVRTRLKRRARWALVGGPPCQAYSLVGRSRMSNDPEFEQDERHFLYREYLTVIADHRPPVFVMENVKGLLSASVGGKPMISRILADLRSPRAAISGRVASAPEYRLYSLVEPDQADEHADPRMFLVRAEDHGVPQARHRMFIVGIRADLDLRPSLLERSNGPTVREMIGDLPPIRSTLSRETDSLHSWRSAVSSISTRDVVKHLNGSTYTPLVHSAIEINLAKLQGPESSSAQHFIPRPGRRSRALSIVHDPELDVLTGHEARSHMASDLRRYMYAAVFAEATGRSPKLADFPPSLLPSHGNVDKGVAGEMFSDRFRVQLPDAPSTTITSHISKDGHYFIHFDPLQCRSLTVREAARLQTFPDNYFFLGNRTQQYHQVGNAVPPLLARQIAAIVAELLDAVPEED
ncbi:restriction endonuclease subunit M [Youhaiella tibetensis]|uniref:DNA (cytosine-5-)-methyltransferase n=1 Tax=Paradevosia tibetensis TaxID=1447062 RepID=A0A5B9DJ53_9HYPH|nr:DNA (cytosine-5-)-methyltransferase [Youhaiella tibetensis]QEE19174.1 DNA cytosine methyltransferase [Youhaiella tibetensis]GGF35583.1 restriction endonuclease subunit M [Youhaiella tibetensis]